jgi:hypothetical protein
LFQQTATRREVLLVCDEVLSEVIDALGEQGDLEVGATGIAFVKLELFWIDWGCDHGLDW